MEPIEILSTEDEDEEVLKGTGVERSSECEIISSDEEEDDDASVIEMLDDDLDLDTDDDSQVSPILPQTTFPASSNSHQQAENISSSICTTLALQGYVTLQAQPAQTQGGRQQQQQQHQLHQGLDLTGGSQPTFFTEFHIQREVYNMYVDGSYRNEACWPLSTRMSAGGFTSHAGRAYTGGSWPQFSTLLLGGQPDSLRAELGAIHVGCQKLLGALQAQELDAGTCEVHMHTDCQGAANMLKRPRAKVPPRYKPLVSGRSAHEFVVHCQLCAPVHASHLAEALLVCIAIFGLQDGFGHYICIRVCFVLALCLARPPKSYMTTVTALASPGPMQSCSRPYVCDHVREA